MRFCAQVQSYEPQYRLRIAVKMFGARCVVVILLGHTDSRMLVDVHCEHNTLN